MSYLGDFLFSRYRLLLLGVVALAGESGAYLMQVAVRQPACVDLSSDVANCGVCSLKCAEGQSCSGGVCYVPGAEAAAGGWLLFTDGDVVFAPGALRRAVDDYLSVRRSLGFKLEAPPLHPVLFAVNLAGFGRGHAASMARFPHAHALIALIRDGFHPDSPGGRVALRDDGSPVLDYPLTAFLFDGVPMWWSQIILPAGFAVLTVRFALRGLSLPAPVAMP